MFFTNLYFKIQQFKNNTFYIFQAGAKAICHLIIHVLDCNDNAPQFLETEYYGVISEDAAVDSLIMTNESIPLVILATDKDSQINSVLQYHIIEPTARNMFHIDSTTGKVLSLIHI